MSNPEFPWECPQCEPYSYFFIVIDALSYDFLSSSSTLWILWNRVRVLAGGRDVARRATDDYVLCNVWRRRWPVPTFIEDVYRLVSFPADLKNKMRWKTLNRSLLFLVRRKFRLVWTLKVGLISLRQIIVIIVAPSWLRSITCMIQNRPILKNSTFSASETRPSQRGTSNTPG